MKLAERRARLEKRRRAYRRFWKMAQPSISYGYCWCGCGNKTKVAKYSSRLHGCVMGEPRKRIQGHARKLAEHEKYEVVDMGFDSPCWVWIAGKNSNGYGLTSNKRRSKLAHKEYYEERFGPVPDNLELDHRCRVRACVNPDHLEPVTHAENMRRGGCGRKLTFQQVQWARERVRSGSTQRSAAEALGVSEAMMSSIVLGKSWIREKPSLSHRAVLAKAEGRKGLL